MASGADQTANVIPFPERPRPDDPVELAGRIAAILAQHSNWQGPLRYRAEAVLARAAALGIDWTEVGG